MYLPHPNEVFQETKKIGVRNHIRLHKDVYKRQVSGVPTEGKLAVTCDNDITVSEKDGKYTACLLYTSPAPHSQRSFYAG